MAEKDNSTEREDESDGGGGSHSDKVRLNKSHPEDKSDIRRGAHSGKGSGVQFRSDWEDESEGGEGSHSGTTTDVAFHLDFLAGERRDDLLPPEELKRLLKVHLEHHYDLVKKQKIERKSRLEAKEGKRSLVANAYTGETGFGMSNSGLQTHPISAKAYFSGIDKKVTGVVSENTNTANEDMKNELEQRYELKNRLQHTHTPKFNPRPQPF